MCFNKSKTKLLILIFMDLHAIFSVGSFCHKHAFYANWCALNVGDIKFYSSMFLVFERFRQSDKLNAMNSMLINEMKTS